MKYLPLDAGLFLENRRRFVKALKPSSIAIFVGNDAWPSNGDGVLPFKQASDLFWLTGVVQEDTMLILFPDNPDPKYREVLVLVRPNEMKEKWDGKRLRKEEATAISRVETIVWLDLIEGLLQPWVHLADRIYLDSNENDRKSNPIVTREYRYIESLKAQYPLHQFERSAKILRNLRAVKTPAEIVVLQKAIDITEQAFRRLLGFIRPGVMEYEIEAEILHEFLRSRASGPAYSSIIASGDRARTLHYVFNNQECKAGELVLMDFGAEYGGYCADLTRTVPVNGKFTARQKGVYNGCLHIHEYCKSILKPGISLVDYTEKVGEEATRVFVKLGLITKADVKNEDRDNRAYRKYLYHGISHHLGVDVHDLGTKVGPLEEGMVLTVEPGIYIEAEAIGIRIENNVQLTKKGNNDLMKHIPVKAEEIEALMRKK
jgi:Xaa-Pro aminopeptidase